MLLSFHFVSSLFDFTSSLSLSLSLSLFPELGRERRGAERCARLLADHQVRAVQRRRPVPMQRPQPHRPGHPEHVPGSAL